MPVFNAEIYLRESIGSVLSQTLRDFELIIVNDGSTDDSEAIIKSFQDNRIRYFKQKNQGQVMASNHGISKAHGQYIKFVDADDLINKEHLKLQYEAINAEENLLVSCEWAYFYKDPSLAVFQKEFTHQDYDNAMNWFYDSHYHDRGMLGAPLWLIPKKLLDKAGYWHPELSLNNDFDFTTRLLAASKGVKFAKGAKLYYRKGVENALTLKSNKWACQSALLTTELAMTTILRVENSKRMRKLFADRFQSWIYQFYPQHSDVLTKMESHVLKLGGSHLVPEGGRLFLVSIKILPWKLVKWLQFLMHRSIWKPVLRYKQKIKLKNLER
jgi:glycosyltransferase involved in cell wall biosynthesis